MNSENHVSKEWVVAYRNYKASIKPKEIESNQSTSISLVKFFISSNVAISALENKHLRDALKIKISKYSFKKEILPSMVSDLEKKISLKLVMAEFVVLITDIWSCNSKVDYLGLAASLIYFDIKRETLVLGISRMKGVHCAENVALTINDLLKVYDFDKSKITSVVTDEGSNLLRLFKQVNSENCFYLNYIQDDIDDPNDCNYEPDNDDDDSLDSEDELEDEVDEEEITWLAQDLVETQEKRNGIELAEEGDLKAFENEFNNSCTNLKLLNTAQSFNFESTNQTSINYPVSSTFEQEELLEYDLSNNRKIISDLNLKVGSNQIQRYSCAAHKLNVAVRRAIASNDYVSKFLSDLSNFVSNVKKSTENTSKHREKKSKLHRQNLTRWSSSLMMLASYVKSFRRNVFNDQYYPPYQEKEIIEYLRILLPIYTTTNEIQSDKSNISTVVPALILMLEGCLKRLVLVDENQSTFRDSLVNFIKCKFNFE